MGEEMSATGPKSFTPREVRAPLQLRVDYNRMNMFFADYTKNISKGGTFIKTATPLPVGTRFVFQLSIPGFGAPVDLNGEVTWSVQTEDAATSRADAGMGIRFVFTTPAEKTQFESRVEKLMKDNLGEDIYRQLLGKTA
jgi:type IV pilus assembly protein PilZ